MREWKLCKEEVFNSFDLPNVDVIFFFIVWDHHTVNEEDIRNDFKNKNLGGLEIISDGKCSSVSNIKSKSKSKFIESYDRMTFIRQYASMVVNEYELEHDFIFDIVVDTRPDLFITTNKICSKFLFSPDYVDFVIGSSQLRREKNQKAELDSSGDIVRLSDVLFVDDLIFSGNSLSMGIFNAEYEFLLSKTSHLFISSPHHFAAKYILESNLVISNAAIKFFSQFDICRPGITNWYKELDIWKVRDYALKCHNLTEFAENTTIVVPMCDGRAFRKISDSHVVSKLVQSINLPIANYIFVCSKKDNTFENKKILESLGLARMKMLFVDRVVKDQVSAITAASKLLNSNDRVIVVNSDQIFNYDSVSFIDAARTNKDDCLVLTFEGSNPKWSYSLVNADGEIISVAEKEVISNTANAGLFYFKKASDLFSSIDRLKADKKTVDGKFYLSPAINYMISDGKAVKEFKSKKAPIQVGTQQEIACYESTNNKLRLH